MNDSSVYGNKFMLFVSLHMYFNLYELAHICILPTHVHIPDLNIHCHAIIFQELQ
jgi:hypothetical protein